MVWKKVTTSDWSLMQIVRTMAIVFISSLYCVSSGIANCNSAFSAQNQTGGLNSECYFSDLSANLLSPGLKTENTYNPLANIQLIGHPDSFLFFLKNSKSEILPLYLVCEGFLSISENFVIHYRKADLIFPFQYFW